jgi:hypothetical protein
MDELGEPAAGSPQLGEAEFRLLAGLGRALAALGDGGQGDSWRDEEFLYLESHLGWHATGPVDVSVRGRKLFVRIAL